MKSDLKSKILVVLILILMISINIAFFNQMSHSEVYNNPLKEYNPQLNAPDITIITPENKTYTEPMSGYYPATYGFECDENRTLPKDWNFYNRPNCNTTILDELDGHKKVIKGDDQNSIHDNWFWIYNNISQTSGTVEFYVRTTDNTEYVGMRVYEVDYWDGLLLDIYNSQFRYHDGSTHNIMAINNNQWYHIRFDFETGSGGYEGLDADKWHLWIDGVKKSSGSGWNFRAPTTQMYFFQFDSAFSDTSGFQAYFDAIGYSWDPNYIVGDNLNEGLLLSFENSTSLDWMGYSFDGQTNNTILGNSTISFPEDGLYTIQVFGNDSIGDIHESDIRYFTIDTIPPEISITYPTTGQEFSDPPSFILSITEEYLVASWYTLNGGSNIPFAGDSGVIDSTAWNALPDGPVTIRFYIRDSADREDFEEVTVVKVPGQEGSPKIPGYNLYIIIGIISIVLITLITKSIKN